jgi:hypothetical protein
VFSVLVSGAIDVDSEYHIKPELIAISVLQACQESARSRGEADVRRKEERIEKMSEPRMLATMIQTLLANEGFRIPIQLEYQARHCG